MNAELSTKYPKLAEAIYALLSVCDGALAQDGMGYNGMDARFVRDIVSKNFCTFKMASALWVLLRKYKTQLGGMGISFDDIPKPVAVAEEKKEVKKTIIVRSNDSVISFTNPYDGELLKIYQSYKFAIWNPTNRYMYFQLNTKWTRENALKAIDFLEKAKDIGWEIDCDSSTRALLTEIRGAKVSKEVEERENHFQQVKIIKEKIAAITDDDNDDLLNQLAIAGIVKDPYPYQLQGIKAIDIAGGKFIIGDEMGLGKTMQAIAWCVLRKKKTLVICPASIKYNWRNEINKFAPDATIMVVAETFVSTTSDFTIVNYEQVKKCKTAIKNANFDCVIMDESHYIKNQKAQRTQNGREVAKDIPSRLLLTGTGIKSRPIEFFTQLNLVDPITFKNFMYYGKRYCAASHNGYGWTFNGASNIPELVELIKHVYIRRNKSEVLLDLPPKIRQAIVIEDAEAKRISENALDRDPIIAGIQDARSSVAEYKIPYIIEWIENWLEQANGNKLLVFSDFLSVVDKIVKHFGSIAVRITGEESTKVKKGMNTSERQMIADSFQNDPNIKIIVGTAAMGEGLNLYAGNSVLFCNLPWTPGDVTQREDRAHRNGQRDTVNVYQLIFKDTIDEDMANILEEKHKILEQVLEGKEDPEGMQTSIMQDLMFLYGNRKKYFK